MFAGSGCLTSAGSGMLDVRRLRVLHAVSTYGSVTAAAAALGYSAPAISQQLAALERDVGMRLTERAGRGIELTPAAGILVVHTDALLAGLDAAESDLAALRDQVSGRVGLAAFPSAAATFVPAAWAALARTAPHVQLDLTEMEPEESLPAVLRGQTDIAIAHEYDLLPRPLDPLFERRELLRDPVLIALPADHPLAVSADHPLAVSADHPLAVPPGHPQTLPATAPLADPAATVPLSALAGLPFLAPRTSTSCAEMIQRACARAGFVPTIVARATDFAVLLSLVAAGAGVTLVPALAARWLPPQVRLLTPAEPVTRQIFTVSRRGGDRKPAVRVVLDTLAAEAAQLPADPAPAAAA
jgi:DNA-binding transcriptional LysR family regulator